LRNGQELRRYLQRNIREPEEAAQGCATNHAGVFGAGAGRHEYGALNRKTKELIALALGVAAHCDGCIGFHVETLVKLGATRQEVEETLGMAVYMGGGPSLM
jgi:AhpD family alkylhydroperoxidase